MSRPSGRSRRLPPSGEGGDGRVDLEHDRDGQFAGETDEDGLSRLRRRHRRSHRRSLAAQSEPESPPSPPPYAQDDESAPPRPPSQREGCLRLLTTITRRRTPAITTSANSIRDLLPDHCRRPTFHRCFRGVAVTVEHAVPRIPLVEPSQKAMRSGETGFRDDMGMLGRDRAHSVRLFIEVAQRVAAQQREGVFHRQPIPEHLQRDGRL